MISISDVTDAQVSPGEAGCCSGPCPALTPAVHSVAGTRVCAPSTEGAAARGTSLLPALARHLPAPPAHFGGWSSVFSKPAYLHLQVIRAPSM